MPYAAVGVLVWRDGRQVAGHIPGSGKSGHRAATGGVSQTPMSDEKNQIPGSVYPAPRSGTGRKVCFVRFDSHVRSTSLIPAKATVRY